MFKVGDKVEPNGNGHASEVDGTVVEVVDLGGGFFTYRSPSTGAKTHGVIANWNLVDREISVSRKDKPVFSGVLMYFPDALLAVAEHSKKGNDKHNPGQPLHWAKEKSKDQADCIARHLIDIGPNWDEIDPETGSLHAAALAWRALALLQTVLERSKDGS